MNINEGTLQEDGYNEQYAEEQFIRSCAYKGLSCDWEICEYYQSMGLAKTSSHSILQIQGNQ